MSSMPRGCSSSSRDRCFPPIPAAHGQPTAFGPRPSAVVILRSPPNPRAHGPHRTGSHPGEGDLTGARAGVHFLSRLGRSACPIGAPDRSRIRQPGQNPACGAEIPPRLTEMSAARAGEARPENGKIRGVIEGPSEGRCERHTRRGKRIGRPIRTNQGRPPRWRLKQTNLTREKMTGE